MSILLNISPKGLHVFENQLASVPEGALLEADNVVIDRDGVIEPRRGFGLFGTLGNDTEEVTKQLLTYKDRILGHISSSLYFDSNGSGTFLPFDGVYEEAAAGLRIKAVESNGNLYFTTSDGIKKIGASSSSDFTTSANFITNAGGIPAINNEAWLSSASGGWLPGGSAVGYKIVWGIRDLNTNNILGVPSNQTQVYSDKTTLLINSFNTLLTECDSATALSDTNYYSSLSLSSTDSASVLYNNILSLASKLDVDLGNNKYSGVRDIDSITQAPTNPTITTLTDHNLSVGSSVEITGSTCIPSIDGVWQVATVPTSTTFTITGVTITTDQTSNVGQVKYTGAVQYGKDVEPQLSPTGNDLQNLEDFLDGIISQFLVDAPSDAFSSVITASNVYLKINIPSGISTSHFYQVYRTAVFNQGPNTTLSDIIIDDEHLLVKEGNPTAAEITTGSLVYLDQTPESFRNSGSPLYTNPNTGQGAAQTNNRPPLAKDIALFKNSVWYADTQTYHRKIINLISVLELVSGTSVFRITDFTDTNDYTFITGVNQEQTFTTLAGTLLGGKYFTLSSARDRTDYYVWYNTGSSTDPAPAGLIGIEVLIDSADSDSLVAEKTATALNATADFAGTSASTNTISLYLSGAGLATAAADVDTGFSFNAPSPNGSGEDASAQQVLLSANPSPAQAIDETAQSLVRVINTNPNSFVYAYYQSTAATLPGIILLERKTVSNVPFYLQADSVLTASQFTPTLQVYFTGDTTAGSPIIQNIPDTTGFEVGGVIDIGDSQSTILTVDSSTQITLNDNISVTATGSLFGYGNDVASSNEAFGNRLYYSKYGEPEAVPLLNYLDLGPKDKRILRIIPLRESLLIFKEEAIYRLTGESAFTGFVANLFDSSTNLLAPDSAATLNNQIYMYSQQGVAVVSETGVSIISRPIENVLIKIRQFANMSSIVFGVSYEADRAYLLFVPTVSGDTIANQVYRYNTFTQTWTRFKSFRKNCGVVLSSEDKMYLGDDSNAVERERKSFERQDYADRSYPNSIIEGTVLSNGQITISTSFNVEAGDIIEQTQYLTIAQYNRLLQQLDNDPLLDDTDYSDLAAVPGNNLRDKLDSLAEKLDADTGSSTYTTAISSFSGTFSDQQDAFNAIVTALNADVSVSFSNYLPSTGTTSYDANILSVSITPSNSEVSIPNSVVVHQYVPFISGEMLVYKHIKCRVTTVPQTFGNPSMFRHVREGTFIFENSAFIGGNVGFASDLMPSFESEDFGANGNGIWGQYDWSGESSGNVWGGEGTGAPYRTFIPRDKQRCRWLKVRFNHINAWNKFSLYGISLVAEEYSTKAYGR